MVKQIIIVYSSQMIDILAAVSRKVISYVYYICCRYTRLCVQPRAFYTHSLASVCVCVCVY